MRVSSVDQNDRGVYAAVASVDKHTELLLKVFQRGVTKCRNERREFCFNFCVADPSVGRDGQVRKGHGHRRIAKHIPPRPEPAELVCIVLSA